MFHMTSHSGKFKTRAELVKLGFEASALNRWRKGDAEALPLYEGKMVQMFDHRAADVVVHTDNLHRAAQPEAIPAALKERPDRLPTPQFFVQRDEVAEIPGLSYSLGFKDVTAPTNVRTMIAALLPLAALGNTLPVLLPNSEGAIAAYKAFAPLLLANLNSMAFDYVARQKVQGQHLNWFIVEQLPVVAPERFEASVGDVKIADFIREQVLALSYTAHDLAPFARDLGYVEADGSVKPPFTWHDEDRRARLAALDGLFMHLYGLDDADAAYILNTFPIIREQDNTAFGCFRTKDDVLAALQRVSKGVLAV